MAVTYCNLKESGDTRERRAYYEYMWFEAETADSKYYVMEAAIVETRSSPARRIIVSFNGRTVAMSVAGLAGLITGEI